MMRRLVLCSALLQVACAPSLDWREVRLPSNGAVAAFPCKPSRESRHVRLAGNDVEMTLHACSASGSTWAVSHADVVSPTSVGPALDEMSAAVLRNIRADAASRLVEPFTVAGMTPNPRAARLHASGTGPDGSAVSVDTVLFAKGTSVFQATVLGGTPDAQSSQTFFASLRLP